MGLANAVDEMFKRQDRIIADLRLALATAEKERDGSRDYAVKLRMRERDLEDRRVREVDALRNALVKAEEALKSLDSPLAASALVAIQSTLRGVT